MSAGADKLNMYAIQNAVNENFGLNRNKKWLKSSYVRTPKDADYAIKNYQKQMQI